MLSALEYAAYSLLAVGSSITAAAVLAKFSQNRQVASLKQLIDKKADLIEDLEKQVEEIKSETAVLQEYEQTIAVQPDIYELYTAAVRDACQPQSSYSRIISMTEGEVQGATGRYIEIEIDTEKAPQYRRLRTTQFDADTQKTTIKTFVPDPKSQRLNAEKQALSDHFQQSEHRLDDLNERAENVLCLRK